MLNVKAIKLFRSKRFILGFFLLTIGLILTLAITQKYLLPNTTNVTLNSYMDAFKK
jgi:uncharacterized protein involved in exopolysaccharide biosynthesis